MNFSSLKFDFKMIWRPLKRPKTYNILYYLYCLPFSEHNFNLINIIRTFYKALVKINVHPTIFTLSFL